MTGCVLLVHQSLLVWGSRLTESGDVEEESKQDAASVWLTAGLEWLLAESGVAVKDVIPVTLSESPCEPAALCSC